MRHYNYKMFKKTHSIFLMIFLALSHTSVTHAVNKFKVTKKNSVENLASPEGKQTYLKYLMAKTANYSDIFHTRFVNNDGGILIITRDLSSKPFNDSHKYTHVYYENDGSIVKEAFQNIPIDKDFEPYSRGAGGRGGRGIEISRRMLNPNDDSKKYLYAEDYSLVKSDSSYYRIQKSVYLFENENPNQMDYAMHTSIKNSREFEIEAKPELMGLANVKSGTKELEVSYSLGDKAPPGFIESVRVEGNNVYVRVINDSNPEKPSLHEIKYQIVNPTDEPLGKDNSPILHFIREKKLPVSELNKAKAEVEIFPPAEKVNPKNAKKNSKGLNSDSSLPQQSSGDGLTSDTQVK